MPRNKLNLGLQWPRAGSTDPIFGHERQCVQLPLGRNTTLLKDRGQASGGGEWCPVPETCSSASLLPHPGHDFPCAGIICQLNGVQATDRVQQVQIIPTIYHKILPIALLRVRMTLRSKLQLSPHEMVYGGPSVAWIWLYCLKPGKTITLRTRYDPSRIVTWGFTGNPHVKRGWGSGLITQG